MKSVKATSAVAAVDVGSNAMRLEIAEVRSTGDLVPRETLREPVRLGRRVFMTGMLEEAEMEKAVAALSAFRATMERHGVTRYRAVATSAVREAQNRDLFIERAASFAHVEVESISGAEETRLLTVGVARRIDLTKKRVLLIDIGGGSVELAFVDRGKTVFSQSHRLGAVRLAELFLEGKRGAEEKRALLEEYIERMAHDSIQSIRKLAPQQVIAVGGNADTIGRIIADVPNDTEPLDISARDVGDLADQLIEMDVHARAREYDLKPDRADTIVPAIVLLQVLLSELKQSTLTTPFVGIRDGVLAELADQVAGRYDVRAATRGVVAEAERLGQHYHYDAAHAAVVRDMSLRLFDALRPEHRLGDHDRVLLAVAAVLHDVGEHVGYAHHHKHSHYLISNAEIGGLSSDDLRIVSVTARFHRRAHPSDRHEEYASLSREDRRRVSRLAAILRVADSLDREHRQKVKAFRVGLKRGAVTLHAKVDGDFTLERWALPAKASLFREVFGREVVLSVEGERKLARTVKACATPSRARQ